MELNLIIYKVISKNKLFENDNENNCGKLLYGYSVQTSTPAPQCQVIVDIINLCLKLREQLDFICFVGVNDDESNEISLVCFDVYFVFLVLRNFSLLFSLIFGEL